MEDGVDGEEGVDESLIEELLPKGVRLGCGIGRFLADDGTRCGVTRVKSFSAL